MTRTILVFLTLITICYADPIDKHTLRTSEHGDEGKFGGGMPGNTNAMILWPHDSPSIVRRHRPDGHSKTTPKAIKLWSERGAGGFPVNLKSGDGFCSFLSKIVSEPDLHACICDDTAAWDTGTPFTCTDPVHLAQCSPSACFAGTPTTKPPPGNSCTVTDWSPGTKTVCAGDIYDQTRTLEDCSTETRTATGTKQCDTTCPETDWSPETGAVCLGSSFTQSRTLSDCSTDTRTATGTRNCNSCTVQDWTPGTSSVCLGDTFTQSRIEADCSTSTRQAVGTKDCPTTCTPTNWSPPQSGYCTTDQFTQTRTLSDCNVESRTVHGTKYCPPPTCRYSTGPWTPSAAGRCTTDRITQTRTVTVVNQPCAGGSRPASSQTVSGDTDCSLPACRWSTGPWSPSAANYCTTDQVSQSRTVTLTNSPCEGGTAPASSQTVSGSRVCSTPCTYSTGAWSPSASTVCDDQTITQTRPVTSSPPNCTPGTPPPSSQTVSGTMDCGGVDDPPPPPPPTPLPDCPSGYSYWGTGMCGGSGSWCCIRLGPGPGGQHCSCF